MLGAGGHASVVLDAVQSMGNSVDAFITNDGDSKGITIPVYDDNWLLRQSVESVSIFNGVGMLPRSTHRAHLFNVFYEKGFKFPVLMDRSAIVSKDCSLSDGVQVMHGAIVQRGVRVGLNTILNTRVSADHDCLIGEHCHLAPGALLSGGVFVGDGVFIGVGAVIVQNIKIGENSIVGAGAVVTEDVPANSIVYPVKSKIEQR